MEKGSSVVVYIDKGSIEGCKSIPSIGKEGTLADSPIRCLLPR